MRPLFTATLAASALLGLSSLPADATVERPGTSRFAEDGTARLQFARTTVDDGRVRPRRSASERWERPRRARPAHARSTKRARRHGLRQARWHGRQVRRHVQRPRRVVRRLERLAARPYPIRALPIGADIFGVASYYWQGHTTASGARYNPNGLTAAHRTLPFGTRVRVTHLGNGRSVDVRINDRGPYIAGRIIDLSRGAAGVIGIHQQGVARVKVTVLGR